ncbi:MAG: alpha/beta fold hydrolase [Pseudomonadota bacterium]
MIYWTLVILAGLVAVPLMQEITRTSVTSLQASAPGHLTPLPRGQVHHRWSGPEGGPVAVCVHGLTTSSYVWDAIVAGLVEDGYRVLTYDHYGRGYSDHPRGRQDAAFFNEALDALLTDQGVEGPVTLVGYSMGGAVAASFAAAYPIRVTRIVMIASAGLQAPPGGLAGIMRQVPLLGDWLMLALYPWVLRAGLRAERDLPKQVDGIARKQEAELDVRGFIPAVLSSLRGILSAPLLAEHRAIAEAGVPVHAIWGSDDAFIPLDAMDQLADLNSSAMQDVIADGTHALPYSHADEVLDLMRAQAG